MSSSGKTAAKVEILNHTSSLVDKDAPDVVFKNLNVWVGNMGWFSENNVKDPTFTFMVDRTWVKNNRIDLSTISLYSYNNSVATWEKISTEMIEEDPNRYYFNASLPTRGILGPMAISGRVSEVLVPLSTHMMVPTQVETPLSAVDMQDDNSKNWLLLLLALFGIILMGYIRKKAAEWNEQRSK